MRFIISLIGLFITLSTPAYAEDMFTYFERGSWGSNQIQKGTCEINPKSISFSVDRTRAILSHSTPMVNYLEQVRKTYGYDIISFDGDGIVMRLDGEQRLTPNGETVVWVLKPLPNDMYCWGRTDWPSTGCLMIHVRCPELPPIS